MRGRELAAHSLVGLLAACADPAADELVVGAAASLRDVLEASVATFEAEHPGVRLVFSFEASSTLARQTLAGAPYDVFLSADAENLRRVEGRLAPGSSRPFLRNRLALVAAAERGQGVRAPADLLAARGRIAVAMPAVPAGRYAREWLAAHDLRSALEERFVEARNVRATLALVQSQAAEFGFVYASDLYEAAGLELLWSAGSDEAPRIAYHAAAIGEEHPLAADFLEWLFTPAFQDVAAQHGFTRWQP